MKERFRHTLETYGELAKDAMRDDLSDADVERLNRALDWHIEHESRRRDTPREAQERIVELQGEKQQIMKKLHEEIAALDNPEYQPGERADARPASYEDGEFIVRRGDGTSEQATLGEIMTDGEWGIEYALDAETVPRNIRKRYLIEEARRTLQALLDEQIIVQESESGWMDEKKRDTYRRIQHDAETDELPSGIIAERMVENFLKKLMFDYDVDFSIQRADVFQDVEQKIDFIIRRVEHDRGVRVYEDPRADRVGVQFTTSTNAETLHRKASQVERSKRRLEKRERIDDIVIVSIPLREASALYHQWKHTKRAGGPDAIWDDATKETIFREVVKGVFSPDEIDEEWGKIASQKVVA
jgi:hypothetical protein